MHDEMRCARDGRTCQDGLKLFSGLQPLHVAVVLVWRLSGALNGRLRQPGACGPWRDVR